MTYSPTPTELLALKTAHAAEATPDASYDLVSTIVFALGAAQLLQSPDTAAEMARLRARVAELETRTVRVRTEDLAPGDRVWGDHARFIEVGPYPHELESNPWNTGTAMRITGVDFDGNPLVLDALASKEWVRDKPSERERLRTRIAELEAERHSTNEALSDAAERMRRDRDRIAELEATLADLTEPDVDGAGRTYESYQQEPAALHEAAAAKLRGFFAEDPHDSPLHHPYLVGRDLPRPAGSCDACGAAPEQWCPDCGACRAGCHRGHDNNSCSHPNAPWAALSNLKGGTR